MSHKAPGGNVTLLVPRSWSVRAKNTGSSISILIGSPEGAVLAAVTESVADFDSQLDLPGYTEILRAVYTTKFEASLGPVEATTIGGVPAQRVSFEGSERGVRLKGYIYLANTEVAFCHIVTYTSPSKFDELEAALVRAVERSTID